MSEFRVLFVYPNQRAESLVPPAIATFSRLLKDRGIKVNERHIMPEELESFEQCWLTGTAAEVTPVGQIGDYNFEVSALARDISEGYEKLVRE